MFSFLYNFLWDHLLSLSQFYFVFEKKIKKSSIILFLYNFIYNVQIEPNEKEWTNISWLIDNTFHENYSKPKDMILYPENKTDYLLTVFVNSNYYIRESRSNVKNIDSYLYFSKLVSFQSNIQFSCIEYFHPKRKEPVSILLDSKYFMIGNEILSSIFISRYFHYTYGTQFYHDDDYELVFLDKDMNYFTLNKNNYIFIDKDSYKIKSFQNKG